MIDRKQPPNAGQHPAPGTYSYARADLDAVERLAPIGKKLGRPPLAPEHRRTEYTSLMLTAAETELVERARLASSPVLAPAIFIREIVLARVKRR